MCIPFRYNYDSGVLGIWRQEPDPNDLTLIPSSSPFLQEKLASLPTAHNSALGKGNMLAVILNVACVRNIQFKAGGTGKLYPALSHLSKKGITDLREGLKNLL